MAQRDAKSSSSPQTTSRQRTLPDASSTGVCNMLHSNRSVRVRDGRTVARNSSSSRTHSTDSTCIKPPSALPSMAPSITPKDPSAARTAAHAPLRSSSWTRKRRFDVTPDRPSTNDRIAALSSRTRLSTVHDGSSKPHRVACPGTKPPPEPSSAASATAKSRRS